MKVLELSERLGAPFRGDGGREIRGVASLEAAGPEDLSYAENARTLKRAEASRAGCIIVPPSLSVASKTTLLADRPKHAFVKAANLLLAPPPLQPGVHISAVAARSARLSPDASVGPHAVIEAEAKVGARSVVGPGAFVGAGSEIGEDCWLGPNVSIYPRVKIGNRVILHAGVVIGSDGFGYVFMEGRHHKFPQVGGVVIEDDVEIGSNSTVDRGSLGMTVIGEGSKIDNLVQIAHNVKIGRHTVIAAQTGISGSCEIGEFVMMGGQAGLGDHARIGARAVIGGQTGVLPGKIVQPGSVVWGTPARPLDEIKKMQAEWARLAKRSQKRRK